MSNKKSVSSKKVNSNKNNTSKKTKQKKKDNSRIGFLLFSVVVFIVVLISTISNDLQQIISNKKETEELNQKYVELLEEEASLSSEVTKLQDPDYLKRYAREKYMYTMDGEKILTIIDSSDLEDNEVTG